MLTESIEVQIFRFLIQTQTADNEKGAKPEHRGMWSFRDCSSEGGATVRVLKQSGNVQTFWFFSFRYVIHLDIDSEGI